MEKIIYKWIEMLVNNSDMPLEIIDDNFTIEDGMNLDEYWKYEKSNFDQYAENCRLKEGFEISIVNIQKLNDKKNIVSFYVKNNLGTIIFKMNITIFDNSKISSNNYYSHIVPKFVIEKNKITKLGLAIKSPKEIDNIISSDLELVSFDKSSSFNDDGFYTAQFEVENEIENKAFNFYIKMGDIKEKRTIFFDNFDLSLCPYILGDWTVTTKDDAYPVNLAVYYLNGLVKNVAYPKTELEGLYGVKKIIVTDSLDNDWIISIK